jgi:hypothetical protein
MAGRSQYRQYEMGEDGDTRTPNCYFVPKDVSRNEEYKRGWGLLDIFPVSNNGLKSDRDELFFDFDKPVLQRRMQQFFVPDLPDRFREQYRIADSSNYDGSTTTSG